MNPEEILIWNNGYTDTAYSTCGEYECTAQVLARLGVPGKVIEREGSGLTDFPLDKITKVSVQPLGEGDSDEWCAAKGCGEFIRHGMECECPLEDGEKPDRFPYPAGHINLN